MNGTGAAPTGSPTGSPTDRSVQTILAINFNHDGSGVLLRGGEVAGFVTTERLSRRKKHPGMREEDLDELLDQAGVAVEDIDHALLCNLHNLDSPDVARLHGSDLKETWFDVWINQRFDTVTVRGHRLPCTVNPYHHLLHASAAYYTSPYESAVALAIDPTGCRAFLVRGNRLHPLRRDYDSWFNANTGYGTVAEELFGSSIVGAGKVMGLAPYGRTDLPVDGLGVAAYGQLMELASRDPVLVEVDGRPLNATLAYLVQVGLEQQLVRVFGDLDELARRNRLGTGICYSGGSALNSVANQIALDRSGFDTLHLHPACGDDGTALGAALWYWHDVLGNPRRDHPRAELMYSVRRYEDKDVRRALDAAGDAVLVEDRVDQVARTAELLTAGKVVGWFDGAGEIGPRALGHRSILADPRDPGMRDRLNNRVKFREHFRPFAPSVLDAYATEWFGISNSPFMLRASEVRRPGVPAVTHVDGSSRIQTVVRADNPAYFDLITRFHQLTGVPLVLNTSLNIKGEPIVETPADAVAALLGSELDALAFPGLLVTRRGRR